MRKSTTLVPRERSGAPITNGPTGFVRRHVVRSASREGSERGPYRKFRLNGATHHYHMAKPIA
jgi:hypothetical protein